MLLTEEQAAKIDTAFKAARVTSLCVQLEQGQMITQRAYGVVVTTDQTARTIVMFECPASMTAVRACDHGGYLALHAVRALGLGTQR